MLRSFCLYALLFVTCLLAASPADRRLYDAYLRQDMHVWADYLETIRWQDADNDERSRILLCEYGYVPYLYSVGDTVACRIANHRYKQHIEAAKDSLSEEDWLSHCSAVRIYSYMLGEAGIGDVVSGMRLSRKALQADSLNPLALYMRANICFHFPKLFGGSKKKALQYCLRAERAMERDTAYRYHWMYTAVQLEAAQCYDKLGHRTKALEQCRRIMLLHPQFIYVTDTFLPSLSDQPDK